MEETRRQLRLLGALLAVATMFAILATATGAGAQGAEQTKGPFTTTAAGADRGYDIEGTATMLRVPGGADGKTHVFLSVKGLVPGTGNAAHVHNAPCATGGGSHYQHVVGGAVDAVNEIWPTIATSMGGTGHGFATHGHWARPEAQSVVIHAADGVRLACADLS